MYNPVPPTTTGSRPVARVSAIHPAASRANRPALYRSPGSIKSSPRWRTRAMVSGSGFAVPISRVRYTWRASAEMTVMGASAASATATAVLPTPVEPTTTGVRSLESGAAEPALKLFLGKLHHGRPAMNIMRGQCRRQQPHDQLAHFLNVELLPSLDRGAAGIGRGESLEPVLPAAEAAAGEVGDELLETARRLEARMRVRRR